MPTTEIREPDGSEPAKNGNAGEAKKQTDSSDGLQRDVQAVDHQAREKAISEQRKAMGPPLKQSTRASDADAEQTDQNDEPPVEPA